MSEPSTLHPVVFDDKSDDGRRAALEEEVARREAELLALKRELRELQTHYLGRIGDLYAELSQLEAEIAEIEVRAGLRPPPLEDEDADPAAVEHALASRGRRAAPSDELKKVFREVARSIHPDLALDEPARCRRHSLMAEANRAYAERDADRLRLILQTWEQGADAIEGEGVPRLRRASDLEERLAAMNVELASLRASAIYKLKQKIDKTRAEGWDLFAEMILQVKTEIGRARAKLALLGRRHPAE